MLLEIRDYGDPILREKGRVVHEVGEDVCTLARDMVDTMREEQGVGLAAQQIGLARMICVVDVPPDYDQDADGNRENPELVMPMALINPEILSRTDETWTADEGCLSFPGITAPITRAYGVQLRYQDIYSQMHEIEARGFVARVLQHEIDHLNGVLFVDLMSSVKKVALSGRLKRMKKESRRKLGLV